MAFRKTLAQRLFNISKISNQALKTCRISSHSAARTQFPPDPNKSRIALDAGDDGIFRHFLHKRAEVPSSDLRPFQMGENWMEKLKSLGVGRDRIRLDGLSIPVQEKSEIVEDEGLTVEETRKLLKMVRLEAVKSRLRGIQKSWISYSEFVQICGEGLSDLDRELGLAKMLDESGTVIVLGNIVLLRPEQVAKAIQCIIPIPGTTQNEAAKKELEAMGKHKAVIDKKAEALVRRELYFGLSFFLAQTAAFMRLTFWELTWDVMEPICYYVASTYFMGACVFFLRTMKEPSFEGFYQSRFASKQKQLMKAQNFDIVRYNELKEKLLVNPIKFNPLVV